MADNNVHPSNPPSAPESQNKQPTQPEATLQDVLDTMHDSDFFPRTGKDAPSRFWSAYERVAKQHDDELIERHNGEMDVLLIFAGLFSAVSSAFIVNMQSSLTPSASDTTNALLKILVNKIDNTTFPSQEATLPVWTGPSSTTIWIQTLAYTSLSSSLLAAFGAVLGKQWLGHFKTSRFGRGALHERCERRQRKLDGLESWHFSTILAALPIFLQLSLLFFGIALAGNIWTLQHTVASVIMATTAFGFIFYFFTIVSSLKSTDCPFQTPVSTVLRHVLRYLPFRTKIKRVVYIGRRKITWLLKHFVSYHSRLVSALRHNFRSMNGPEAAAVVELSISEAAGEHPEKRLDLSFLDPPVEIAQSRTIQSRAVRWIVETSTDVDNIAAAAGMVPEIEWTAAECIAGMLDRLQNHVYACFSPTHDILPLAQARAVACLKAITHCSVEQSRGIPFNLFPHGYVYFHNEGIFHMAPDQTYLMVGYVVECFVELNMKSLSLSDRIWMAHMFLYLLHQGNEDPKFVTFLIDFVDTCLEPKSPTRLVADCMLLAGMILGLQIDGRHLARLDKSEAIDRLQISVLDLTLGVLVSDIPGRQDTSLKLLPPLLQQFHSHSHSRDVSDFGHILDRAIRFCFHLLNGEADRTSEDQGRSKNLALLIHIIHDIRINPMVEEAYFTVAQFDLLVDYHLCVCGGKDYDLMKATFGMLEFDLSNNPDRMRRYIKKIIRFMGQETTCASALRAAPAIRVEIASMTQDDIREDFSKALASAVLLYHTQTTLTDNPFEEISFFDCSRDIPYLELLCTLAQDPTWHLQLHQNGHFDNCLAIAKTLLSQNGALFRNYAASVAHIFAIIDASGDETHSLLNAVRAYPRRRLVLHAWDYILDTDFSEMLTANDWRTISRKAYLDSLPSLVVYARKESNDNDEPLIALVEQVCRKLDERKQREHQETYLNKERGYKEISDLGNQIRALLNTFLKDV